MDEIVPKMGFTREGRKLEHKLFEKNMKEVDELNIPEEAKEIIKDRLRDSSLEYRHQLAGYQRLFREYSSSSNPRTLQRVN